jgi:serine/threonine-protein kinase HipA
LLADELRRWSVKSAEDRRELFRRMVFNAMVTNNDDHPRNHAMLQMQGDDAKAVIESMLGVVSGWREFFAARGVEARSIEMLAQAMLPASFHRDAPAQSV